MSAPKPDGIAITCIQLRILRHSLGLDRAKKSYRNHYCADPGDKELAPIVAMGLMRATRNGVPLDGLETFVVTDLGKEVVRAYAE